MYCDTALLIFLFNDTATTEIYTLSLHDALPIWSKTNTGAHSLMNTYISASAWPSHLLWPSLNHKKVSPFTQIRPHHLLCIVRTFLLELCFWILTVTVPDPRLNGNLASGPFGFLIEYPCDIASLGAESERQDLQVHTRTVHLPNDAFQTYVAPPSVQLTTPPLDLNLSVLRPEQGELCLNNPYRHRFLEKYKNSLFY